LARKSSSASRLPRGYMARNEISQPLKVKDVSSPVGANPRTWKKRTIERTLHQCIFPLRAGVECLCPFASRPGEVTSWRHLKHFVRLPRRQKNIMIQYLGGISFPISHPLSTKVEPGLLFTPQPTSAGPISHFPWGHSIAPQRLLLKHVQ
jgi:hypothetical protein